MNWQLIAKPLTLGLAMIVAAGLTIVATPTKRMADEGAKVVLEKLVPSRFGDWRIDPTIVPLSVAPDVQAKLDSLYNQTLARTYVDSDGNRVMLSIAYGGDQSDAMRVHRPEVCYTAQGFNIIKSLIATVITDRGELEVKRLVAAQGRRNEPITYWIVVGDRVIHDGVGQKLAQLRYGFSGIIPDGMLVRVSTIDSDEARGFRVQEQFVRSLLSSLRAEDRRRIAGG